jgi:hypothetical protein
LAPSPRTISGVVLSRRQFGLVMGGGALLLAGGTYGVVARSSAIDSTVLSTPFGTLSIENAGRLSRLDAQGRPATKSLSAAASRITGSGAAASMSRARLRAPGDPEIRLAVHSHDDGTLPDSGWPQPANLTWGDVVLLEVALKSIRSEPVLFAPGQLRLKLLPSGITITPQDCDRGPGVIAASRTEYLWISFLAPHDSVDMELEYSEPEQNVPLRLALPLLTVSQGTS